MLAELPDFEHVDANSLDEAVHWLTAYGSKAKIIAGGTDLLGLMKDNVTGPKLPMPGLLINIKTIPGLDVIRYDEGKGLVLGAAATLHSIENDPITRNRFTALAQAAESVGTTQIKFMGTIGGNLCQRPWCWYFRHPDYVCYKRGGKQCYAIPGDNKYYFSVLGRGICVMSHPSDTASALMALDAKIHVYGSEGEKVVPIENFFLGPRDVEETILKNNELISCITVPEPKQGSRSIFLKIRIRNTWDFALASVAVSMSVDNETTRDVRIVLGGVASFPYRANDAEKELRGKTLSKERIDRAAELAAHKSFPLKMNAYKVKLLRSLIRRTITNLSKEFTSTFE